MTDTNNMPWGAVLRGLTFDGEKGCFVQFHSDYFPEGAGVLVLPSAEPEIEIFVSAFKSFESENQAFPGGVSLPGLGTFVLGRSFEATEKRKNLSVLIYEKIRSCRGDVVRGKIAAVTGGAQGFGAGIVRQLVAEGCFVYILDMNISGAALLADELNNHAGRITAHPLEVNVTSEESIRSVCSEITIRTGGLDLFVNNAGVLKAGSVKSQSLTDFSFVTSVNYTGYFLCTKYISPIMSTQNKMAGDYYTDIIQINSKSGLAGSNRNGAYAGGKFGGIGLTQSFALELITDRIKVNSICPGNFFDGPLWSDPDNGLFVQYLNSGKVPGAESIQDVKKFYEAQVPMKRGCFESDVAKAILYVVEQKYETGQAVPVTGGQIMLN